MKSTLFISFLTVVLFSCNEKPQLAMNLEIGSIKYLDGIEKYEPAKQIKLIANDSAIIELDEVFGARIGVNFKTKYIQSEGETYYSYVIKFYEFAVDEWIEINDIGGFNNRLKLDEKINESSAITNDDQSNYFKAEYSYLAQEI